LIDRINFLIYLFTYLLIYLLTPLLCSEVKQGTLFFLLYIWAMK